jgi:hypothetical protein
MAQEISIRQSLSRTYKNKVQRSELSLFCDTLRSFLHERDVELQDEEYNKKLIDKFLTKAFYADTNAINTNNPTDLVIFADSTAKGSHPVVLFEVKMPGNDEMVRRDDLNRKALHELVLYYIREEEQQHNTDIKHLVVTDGLQWFFFDKQVFYDCFVAKKTFCSKVLAADKEGNKTKYIFQKIIAPHVASLKDDELRFCYLNLADVDRLADEQALKSRALENAYKLLSPVFLLKKSVMVDHNELNEEFYQELLYIMGLEEIMQDGVAKIVRCAPSHRHRHSLMEETMFSLEARSDISTDEACEDVALGLVLTWVNRLLFLKLLEAQLMDFNGEEFRKFLTPDRISSFSILNDLFIHVLAQPVDERVEEMADKFEDLPYLNSSLFEYTPLELQYGSVVQLHNGQLEVFRRTRLHDEQKRLLRGTKPVLEYLLRFLNAYDFSGLPIDREDEEEQKTIINAAVLGVIFEKINGYKDGAFFTPSYLSEYICRETIRCTVVEKFNEYYGWACGSYEELVDEVRRKRDKASLDTANEVMNSIRICDPSVGSGHFLVSALNELILIKYNLDCLLYYDSHNRINEYSITIEDGELVIRDAEDKIVKYNPKSVSSRLLQKSLFEEKRTLIENCLFGVDINPKSVEICRLRLWIELLKNAYYEKGVLQTLPNIDSNIRCGNSLISKYPVRVGRSVIANHLLEQLGRYKQLTEDYKNCSEKRKKWAMMREMDKLLASPMVLDQQQRSLFNVSNAIVTSAMDWMTQFPEMLDEKGSFLGFDIVIGNPPYINMQSLPDMTEVYEKLIQPVSIDSHQVKPLYETYVSTGDICSLFFERGLQLLKPKGRLCFVTTNKWLRTGWGENTRRFLVNSTNPQLLVDFPKLKLFKKATVEVCVLMFTHSENQHEMKACTVAKKEEKLHEFVCNNIIPCNFSDTESWVIRSEANKGILQKVKACSKPLGEWGMQINFGIKTGRNDVFIISDSQRQLILSACHNDEERQRTEAMIRPVLKGRDLRRYAINFDNRWLIHTHNGIADLNIPAVCMDDYPALKNYLDEHYDQIKDRGDKGQTPYHLRNCVYWQEFSKPKIVWGEISDKPKFALDEEGAYYCEATTFFMTGSHLVYLLVYLNSPLSAYLFSKLGTTTGAGTTRWKKYKVEQQLVPLVTPEDVERIDTLYHQFMVTQDKSLLEAAYRIIYNHVGLTTDEVAILKNM